jgi:hypothetical protein
MIEHTIVDAADRVDQVPVSDVFSWGRLTKLAIVVGLLSLGMYLFVAGGSGVAGAMTGRSVTSGVTQFHDVAGTWFDRNNLLQNEPWPRRAHLEVLGFEKGEIRISNETVEQPVHVRAIKWGWADDKAVGGYRAATGADLSHKAALGDNLPELPRSWLAAHPEWTVDRSTSRSPAWDWITCWRSTMSSEQDIFTKLPNVVHDVAAGKTRIMIEESGRKRSPYWKELQQMAEKLGDEAPRCRRCRPTGSTSASTT